MSEEEKRFTPSTDVLTWLGIDMETFFCGLEQRLPNSSRKVCEAIGDHLLSLHPVLRAAFKIWWDTGNIPDLGSFSGYTVNDFLTGANGKRKFKPTGLFLMLSDLMTDPDSAKERLGRPVHGFVPLAHDTRDLPSRRKANEQ